MRKFSINTISNIGTKLWSMVSIYIFIPLYIHILGETAYGLVSFFATLQTALNLLGLGLSNTLRREFASGENTVDNAKRKYKLLRSIELIYFFLAIIIILVCMFGASFISVNWLNIENLDPTIVASAISLMGFSIALQLIANLYAGCLFGLEFQVLANSLCIGWSFAKSVGSLLVIAFIEPNLIYFYTWHIFSDLIYLLLLRFFSVKKLNINQKVKWSIKDLSNLKTIWRYTFGILLISCIALVNKQLDKVIISRFLTLTELGAYNIATTLGNLTSIIPAALFTTVFPRFTNYATTNNYEQLKVEFVKVNKVVNIILSCMGAYIAIYAMPLIKVWTGSESYINILGIVGTLVVLAITITEYQEIPYALALANGNTKYNVIVGSIFIPIIVFMTYIGIKNFGLLGAGIVYIMMMIGQTVLYEILVLKRFINSKPVAMILKDMVLPLIISILMAYISKSFIVRLTANAWGQSIYAVCCGGITLIALLVVFDRDGLKGILNIIKRS